LREAHETFLEEILRNADEDINGGDEAPEYLAEEYVRHLERECDALRYACRRIREERDTEVNELRAGLRKLADDGSLESRDLLTAIAAHQPAASAIEAAAPIIHQYDQHASAGQRPGGKPVTRKERQSELRDQAGQHERCRPGGG
jgi:hypothetical protein